MISRILALFIAVLCFTPSAHAGDSKAIDAYRKGDLASARTEWLAVLDDAANPPAGAERARILYDLGNVAFRDGKTLEAVGWYTAALQLRPRDADTWSNLEEARSRAKLEPADRGDLSSTLRRVLRSFTDSESRWLAFTGIVALAAALAFEALRGGRMGRWTAIGAALAAIVLCLPCIDHSLRHGHARLLAIEPDKANVRSEPRAKAAVIDELPAGTEVEFLDELPDWTKVRLQDRNEGWVEKRMLFALDR